MESNEAVIKSIEGAHDHALKQYDIAMCNIEHACSMGEFEVWVENLNKEARKLLREKGYRVSNNWFKYNYQYGYYISWK